MRHLDIPTPDGTIDAKLFQPEGQGPWPPVLLFTDFFGPRPAFDHMGQRLASEGYTVLIPNPFYREGRAPLPQLQSSFADEASRQRAFALIGTLTSERLQADATALLDALARQPRVESGPVGLVGYCMGGTLVTRLAALLPERIAAAASYHGGQLATQDFSSPHRLLGRVKAELYFAHADQDPFMDAAAIARLEAAIQESGVKARSETYAGARHGFAVEDRPVYDRAASERHWSTLLALFARTLKKA